MTSIALRGYTCGMTEMPAAPAPPEIDHDVRLDELPVAPPELEPPSNVPPLGGRRRMLRLVVTGGLIVLVLVPLMTAWLPWTR